MSIDWDKLAEPFASTEIEWRLQSNGKTRDGKVWAKVVAYINNRAIMDRLDRVVGPANWKDEFKAGPDGGVLCGLSIRVDGEWITKWDGAENTNIEKVKGGLSGAEKRAAVKWGMGRYLYDLPEGWANIVDKRTDHSQNAKLSKRKGETGPDEFFHWEPPMLPEWARPVEEGGQLKKTLAPASNPPAKPTNGKATEKPATASDGPTYVPEQQTPASEAVGVISKVLAGVSNAPTMRNLAGCDVRVENLRTAGELTESEYKTAKDAIKKREQELMPASV